MFSANDLTKLGEKISFDFLELGNPLNKGLEKVASTHALNQHQIDRVAEAANVKTHLELLKKGADSYVEFDIADPSYIKTASSRTPMDTNDYQSSPISYEDNDISPFKLAGHVFQEEGQVNNSIQKYKEAIKKEAEVQQLHNILMESSSSLDDLQMPIYSLCKQAALGGTPVEDLQIVIKEASGDFADFIIEDILKAPLGKDGINFSKIEKTASKKVNPENELYLATQEFCKEVAFAYSVSDALNEKIASLSSSDSLIEKRAAATFSKKANQIKSVTVSAFKFMKDHPVASAGLGGYLGGRMGAKNRNKTKYLSMDLQNRIQSQPTRTHTV